MGDSASDRPLGSLLTELTRAVSTLFRHEIRLARAEMADRARQAGRGVAAVVTGIILLVVALQALAASVVLALATVMAPWQAALAVAAVMAVVGGLVFAVGRVNVRKGGLLPGTGDEAGVDT